MTTLYLLQLTEEPEEERGVKGDGSDSDESYDDVEIAPVRYTDKTLVESEELPDGYVHLLKNKRKDGRGEIVARTLNEYGKKIITLTLVQLLSSCVSVALVN